MVKKDFARNEVTLVRHNAVKAGSKLPKTTRMLNRWTVMSFTKSHERLLLRQLADPKIRILIMLKMTTLNRKTSILYPVSCILSSISSILLVYFLLFQTLKHQGIKQGSKLWLMYVHASFALF